MKPGSHHIMLLGLKQDLKPGDTVNVTLAFEKAGQVSVQAPMKLMDDASIGGVYAVARRPRGTL